MMRLTMKNPFTLLKDHLTQPSWRIPLRWLGLILISGRIIGAIIFGFLITNLVTEKSLNRINKAINRGDKVVIWPSNIVQKDINDMVLSGHQVQDIVESNTFQGLQAKLNFTNWKKV